MIRSHPSPGSSAACGLREAADDALYQGITFALAKLVFGCFCGPSIYFVHLWVLSIAVSTEDHTLVRVLPVVLIEVV